VIIERELFFGGVKLLTDLISYAIIQHTERRRLIMPYYVVNCIVFKRKEDAIAYKAK